MGLGHGVGATKVEGRILEEPVALTMLMAKAEEEHTTLILQGEGWSPVAVEAVFTSKLLESDRGVRLVTSIPVVRAWEEGPYMTLLSMFTTFGPQHLTYYRRKGGARVPFKPTGVVIPPACPHGGYRFAATFTFLEYAPQAASAAVPCHRARAATVSSRTRG